MEQTFKSRIIIIFISFIFSIISCQKEKIEKKQTDYGINKSKIISCNFPDTIKLNKVVEGKIKYDVNNLDFNKNLISSRFLELILSTNINKNLAEYKEIDKNRLLSFVDSIPTGTFKIAAVFEHEGKQILNIAIRDYMYLKPTKATPRDKIILRTSDCLFSKQVFVVK